MLYIENLSVFRADRLAAGPENRGSIGKKTQIGALSNFEELVPEQANR